MLPTVVLFFLVCAIVAVILLGRRALSVKRNLRDLDLVRDRQNLQTRYSFGEFSPEEYRGRLAQLGSSSTVQ